MLLGRSPVLQPGLPLVPVPAAALHQEDDLAQPAAPLLPRPDTPEVRRDANIVCITLLWFVFGELS